MIVNVDASALEINVAAFLSQDPILMREIWNGEDLHTSNQIAFGLPERLIAKILNFRILYGGSAWSFAHDPDFTSVSTKESYWQDAIDAYYSKYKGIHKWHIGLLQTVIKTGKLVMPTGRTYSFKAEKRNGDIRWPETKIKNYPVNCSGLN